MVGGGVEFKDVKHRGDGLFEKRVYDRIDLGSIVSLGLNVQWKRCSGGNW